jgi:hypothetical protein
MKVGGAVTLQEDSLHYDRDGIEPREVGRVTEVFPFALGGGILVSVEFSEVDLWGVPVSHVVPSSR